MQQTAHQEAKFLDFLTKPMQLQDVSFVHLIIGLFSIDEYYEYLKNASALNKRMTGIIKERLISNVLLLSESASTI